MPRIIETTVYKIGEHPNPEKVFNLFRNNYNDLGYYLYREGEYLYSNEGLRTLCEGYEYEFKLDGSLL